MRATRIAIPALAAIAIAAVVVAVASRRGQAKVDPEAASEDDALVEDGRRFETRTWPFALDRYEVHVEDVGMKSALEPLLERPGAELAVNAGFFDRDGKPVGLVVSGGTELAPLARSLSGGVIASDGERARLFASESFTLPEGARFALQCRPRLVVGSAPNVRSDDGKRSERTALCLRDEGRTLEVVTTRARDDESTGPSLFALGQWLAKRGCEEALNLDGGPSTGVAWREGGAVRSQPPRGPIRHALVFARKP